MYKRGGKQMYKTILVVDDEEMVRDCITEFLNKKGDIAIGCKNGKEAVSYLDKCGPVNVIITDLLMPPGMNGAELSRIAKSRWPKMNMKVIIMTGTLEQLPPDHSADKVISKPFRLEELLPLL
jgi:CheY-like chemotaxis protein